MTHEVQREISDEKIFSFERDTLIIQVENTNERFAWRLGVNGNFSDWTQHYAGILKHKGYFLATAYWEGVFPKFVPFRINEAKK